MKIRGALENHKPNQTGLEKKTVVDTDQFGLKTNRLFGNVW